MFYEAPHRFLALLDAMIEVFGADRRAAACRELTKLHEEKVRGTLAEIKTHFLENEPRGEFTLIVAGAPAAEPTQINPSDLLQQLEELQQKGLTRRQAAKQLAGAYGMKAADIYAIGLED